MVILMYNTIGIDNMKLQSIVNMKRNGILPFNRFRRKLWLSYEVSPDMFVYLDETNSFILDDNKEGEGSRTWHPTYYDLIANDWVWFEGKAWWE